MKAFAVHLYLELLAGLRNRTLLLMSYLMPLGFYGLIGGLMVQINPYFGDQLIPAMVVFAVLSGVILGLPAGLVEAHQADVLRSYRINGAPACALLVIPAIATAVHIVLVAMIITLTAPLLFHVPVPIDWWSYLLVFTVVLFACSGLGALIGVIAGNSRVAVLWQQLVFLPSMLLGGLMVPADILPQSFARIGHLLPAAYAMQAFQSLAFKKEALHSPYLGMLVLVAGGVFAFLPAFYLFSWDSKHETRHGHPLWAVAALAPYVAGALLLV